MMGLHLKGATVLDIGANKGIRWAKELSRQRIGDGSATLEATRRRNTDATLNVQVTKLDTIADEIFSKLKFIKCDVEGHERNVFLGGEQTIRRYRPVVQFESTVTDQRTQISFNFSAVSDTQGCLLLGKQYLHYSNLTAFCTTSLGW